MILNFILVEFTIIIRRTVIVPEPIYGGGEAHRMFSNIKRRMAT